MESVVGLMCPMGWILPTPGLEEQKQVCICEYFNVGYKTVEDYAKGNLAALAWL